MMDSSINDETQYDPAEQVAVDQADERIARGESPHELPAGQAYDPSNPLANLNDTPPSTPQSNLGVQADVPVPQNTATGEPSEATIEETREVSQEGGGDPVLVAPPRGDIPGDPADEPDVAATVGQTADVDAAQEAAGSDEEE